MRAQCGDKLLFDTQIKVKALACISNATFLHIFLIHHLTCTTHATL